jgi:hypothetical protein
MKQKIFMKKVNLLTLIISSIFSLVILEVGLRIFTPFPVSRVSNKVNHEKLGHVMDVNMKEIDEHGFRNNILPSIDVVALGDSHTYGFNVSSDNSWPKLLGRKLKKNVYNFGMGKYGILQYQYLLSKSIELNPEVILLGLYLPNDLMDVCDLVSSNQYWASRAKEFYIDSNLCPEIQKERHTSTEVTNKKKDVSIRKWLKEKFATISIASEYYSRFSTLKKLENGKIINGLMINDKEIKTVIGFIGIIVHRRNMNLNKPHIQMAYEFREECLTEAKKNTELNNIRFGVLFIPSKERVFYKYLMQMDYRVPKVYKELVAFEDALKENISLFLENTGISFIDVLPDMENALLEYGQIYPIKDDGHPNEIGYQIYAESAFNLYQQIIK